jgi:uncharacterized protein (TIGR02285 family)
VVRNLLSRLLLAVFAVWVSFANAQQDSSIGRIVWASVDFPPFQIVDGPYQGTGSFDGMRDLLIREMRDVKHDLVQMNFVEREEAFKGGRLLCSPGMFHTPARERYLVFSKPTLVHLDNRLVFTKRNANRFPAGSPVDLEKVFGDRWLVGGLIASRSFAPNIDALIRRYGGSPNVQLRSLKPSQVLDLLLQGKIDYTIMFSHEAAFLERQAGKEGSLSYRQIAGTPPYILTQVACTRSAWGERVVARVNRLVRQQRNRPEYRQLSERWYAEADKELIRGHYPQLIEADNASPR